MLKKGELVAFPAPNSDFLQIPAKRPENQHKSCKLRLISRSRLTSDFNLCVNSRLNDKG